MASNSLRVLQNAVAPLTRFDLGNQYGDLPVALLRQFDVLQETGLQMTEPARLKQKTATGFGARQGARSDSIGSMNQESVS